MTAEDTAKMASEALQRAKSAHHRLDVVETEIKDARALVSAVARMDEKIGGMQEDITEVKSNVKELTEQPGKRWESVIGAVITGIVGTLLGAVMALVLK